MKISLTLALLTCLAVAQEHPVSDTAIRHVTVINVATGAELRDQTVRIQGSHILSIGPSQPADDATPDSIDAKGAYLVPGLWDMHVHVHDVNELPLYVANGVTGIRVMSGDKDEAGFRAELGRVSPAPAIYLASAIVDGSPPQWPGSIVVKKAADARRAVDEIKAGGADFIKVYNSIPREAYFALADEAKQQHIPFEGHVPDAITAQEASAAGQRSIEHLHGLELACSRNQESLMGDMNRVQFFRQRLEVEAEAFHSFDRGKCAALFSEFRSNDTWQVPTLSVLRIWGRMDDSRFTSDPRLVYIGKKSRDRWQERTQLPRWGFPQFELARNLFSAQMTLVGQMFRSGVPIMAGTDAMNPYCFPGFGLHEELAMMVEAGMTPLAVLQATTLNPAKFMGRSEELGTIEPGKIADLVLLRADPLIDIHNTTQIQGVWLRGKHYDPAAIAELLRNAKEAAKR